MVAIDSSTLNWISLPQSSQVHIREYEELAWTVYDISIYSGTSSSHGLSRPNTAATSLDTLVKYSPCSYKLGIEKKRWHLFRY